MFDVKKPILEVYKRKDGKHAWRLKLNGEIIATDGGQGYENVEDAYDMADKVVNGFYKTDQVSVS